jgi:hypothetical protein
MTLNAIEEKLLPLLADCRDRGVPQRDLDEMEALAKAGEPGVALENLCEKLFEYEVEVSCELVHRIEELRATMGLREEYWTRFGPAASLDNCATALGLIEQTARRKE